jgi:virginiamycin B lyase
MPKLALVVLLALAAGGSSPHVVARVQTGTSPAGAVSAFGAVWVANDRSGTLARLDPATNTTWGGGRLVKVEPRSLRVVRRLRVGPRPSGLRAARGAVWVGFGRSATSIGRVDPGTGTIERVPVGVRTPTGFVTGTRDLWVKAADNVLVRVEPSTRRVVARLSFGGTLSKGTAAADGTLWVPDKEQSVVYRVDPAGARVVGSFAAGPGAFVALRAAGSMWVTSYAGNDVWRFEPGQ